MNENDLYVVKEYNFDNPSSGKIDSIIDNCYKAVTINIFIHLNMFVYMILTLQISQIMQ